MRLSAVAADASRRKFIRAFTVTELIVLIAVIAVLAGLVLGAFGRARQLARRANCQSCLKQIGLSFRTWEGDFGDLYPARYFTNSDGSTKFTNSFSTFQVMSNELNNPRILICPADKERLPAVAWAPLFSNTNTSYFVGLDANDSLPSMILSGDRNLVTNGKPVPTGVAIINTNLTVTWSKKLHNDAGNIGLADGSVQQTSSATLPDFFQSTGTNMVRLAIP